MVYSCIPNCFRYTYVYLIPMRTRQPLQNSHFLDRIYILWNPIDWYWSRVNFRLFCDTRRRLAPLLLQRFGILPGILYILQFIPFLVISPLTPLPLTTPQPTIETPQNLRHSIRHPAIPNIFHIAFPILLKPTHSNHHPILTPISTHLLLNCPIPTRLLQIPPATPKTPLINPFKSH